MTNVLVLMSYDLCVKSSVIEMQNTGKTVYLTKTQKKPFSSLRKYLTRIYASLIIFCLKTIVIMQNLKCFSTHSATFYTTSLPYMIIYRTTQSAAKTLNMNAGQY